jgi:ribonucleotide reductase class II
MVQELPRIRTHSAFPETATTAYPVFYRTYSRKDATDDGERETWAQVCDRTLGGLVELGQLTDAERDLIARMQGQVKALPSGRWLWVGGTAWSKRPENFSGAYNCTSTNVLDWRAFGLMMDLAMMGCGTGAVLEPKYINQLPAIRNRLAVTQEGAIGTTPVAERQEVTTVTVEGNHVTIRVGDSRQGWVKSYQTILELSSDDRFTGDVTVTVDLSDVRPAGEKLKGFGGVANPVKLPTLYERCAHILNKAMGRQLNSVECCLLIDEAAACVVAGNIRRSAGMRQFDSGDELAAAAKDNLWQQDDQGNWRIDPERDALRMANHTRVFHRKPTLEECTAAVRKQFYSGEGAIQWAGEAERRAGGEGRYGLNPCGEILGQDFHCNLAEIHLNQIDPHNEQEQRDAFTAGALAVASLLNHQFIEDRYRQSRLDDPIVGVSFTGLFDFFVTAFGVEWLKWWEAGRPDTMQGLDFKAKEQAYLSRWKAIVHETVWDYCDRHGIKRPNRCTTVQPAGTKSLLTGASPGWHPPRPSASSVASPSVKMTRWRWPALTTAMRWCRPSPTRMRTAIYSTIPSILAVRSGWWKCRWRCLGPMCLGRMKSRSSSFRPWPSLISTCRCSSTTQPTIRRPPLSCGNRRLNPWRRKSTGRSPMIRATSQRLCWPASTTCKPSPGYRLSPSTRRLTMSWCSR